MFLSVGIFHSTRIDKICSEEMQLRKKWIKVAISAKKLHIGKTENSLESVHCVNNIGFELQHEKANWQIMCST